MVESFAAEITMLWLLRVAPYAAMLTLGSVLALTRVEERRRRLTTAFVGLVIVAQTAAGLSQRDFWPFSPYPVVPESASRFREAVWYEVRGVDGQGREAVFDPSPLTRSVFDKWTERTFVTLDPAARHRAASFLLSRRRISNHRILGPFSAPDWLLHRDRSMAGPSGALRVYRHDIRGATLVYQYPAR